MKINSDSVIIDTEGEKTSIPADYVVVAVGSRSRNNMTLVDYLDQKQIPYHIIGDAVKARRAINAIWEGAEVARKI
ncbi:hypothetical protein D3C78_1261450 [compost metagenome]